MAFEELDDLLNSFSEADRPAMRAALERNTAAAERLTQRETVYKAFVDGDTNTLAKVTSGTTTTSPAVDLDALNRSIDDRFGKIFDDPRFNTAVEARAKVLVETIAKETENRAVGRAAYVSDEIYTIRSTHAKEFGEELPRADFEKFVSDNKGKYGSLAAAHDAFVSEKRIQKRIDAARAEGAAHRETNQVPGTSLPNSGTPAGMFIKSNPMNTTTQAARGDALDNAARAFRELSASRVN